LRCRPWTMCAKTHRPGRCQGDLDRCGSKAATGVRRHLVNDRGCSQKKLLPWGIGGIAGLRRRKSRRAARTIPGYSSHGSAPHCRRLAGERRTDAPSLQGMPGPGIPLAAENPYAAGQRGPSNSRSCWERVIRAPRSSLYVCRQSPTNGPHNSSSAATRSGSARQIRQADTTSQAGAVGMPDSVHSMRAPLDKGARSCCCRGSWPNRSWLCRPWPLLGGELVVRARRTWRRPNKRLRRSVAWSEVFQTRAIAALGLLRQRT
jgi:hypothetical protein